VCGEGGRRNNANSKKVDVFTSVVNFYHFHHFGGQFVWWCTAACAEWFPMGTRWQAWGYMREHGYMHSDDDDYQVTSAGKGL
jgi:hypothetical protein